MRPNLDAYLDSLGSGQDQALVVEAVVEEEGEEQSETSKEDDIEDEEAAEMESNYHPGVPTILPRRRYGGARNVETVKDGKSFVLVLGSSRSLINDEPVNFIGPNDELVVSGSDDGNFFVWNKFTADLSGIYEGDGSVVNVIEGHPSLPLLAVSGIDTTVKVTQFYRKFTKRADT